METGPNEGDKREEPMETNDEPEVLAEVFHSNLESQREFLEERIDPDFGLLDRLRANKGITFRQYQEISAERVPFRKSRMILDSILAAPGLEKIAKFRDALRETKQEHIVNYVHGDGEYRSQFGGNWPLGAAKIDILDDNITFLTENIDSAYGLLSFMIQKKAITQRQMDSISVHAEPCKRNEALLDIIRRGSQAEFEGTIEALKLSNQASIADVLILGGMVLSLHSRADSHMPEIDPAEEEIVHQIDEILANRTPEEARQLIEKYVILKNSGLIGAKRTKSILFFFHCRNLLQLRRLLDLLLTEELQRSIELIYNRVLSTASNVGVKVTWNAAEFSNAESRLQEIESVGIHKIVESERMEDDIAHEAEREAAPIEEVVEAEDRRKLAFAGFVEPVEEPIQSDIDINAAILRNNTDFLNQHIRPRGVIDKLHAAEILSDEDTRYIKTLRHVSEKNDELLNVIRNASSERYNTFVSILRESGQTLVADVVEKGGVVLKLKVTHDPADNLENVEKEIVEKLNQLQDSKVPKSEEVWRFLSQLKRANIEIVSSRHDKGVIMWCWCHSQTALRKLDDISMSDTKQPNLLNGLFGLLLSGKETPTISSVYLENPEKDVVSRRHKSVASETQFSTGDRQVFGVAIVLQTKVCLLFRGPNAIVVYEAGDFAKPIEDEMPLVGIVVPVDMAYSDVSHCLYITDEDQARVWKIDMLSSSEKKVEQWLADGAAGDPFTLSVTNDGRVVMVKRGSPTSLCVYDPDGCLVLSMILLSPISIPNHAVETSKGNFIVSYDKDVGVPGGICELTREGQIISRVDLMFESISGVAENVNKLLAHIAKPQFSGANYLVIDDADQLYVCVNDVNSVNGELVIFNSRLVLLDGGKSGLIAPQRVQYNKEKTQLVVTHGVQRNLISTLHTK